MHDHDEHFARDDGRCRPTCPVEVRPMHDHDDPAHQHDHAHGRVPAAERASRGDSHDHAHHHVSAADLASNRAFALGVGLNVAFAAVEFGYGLAVHSMALVADAAHNLSDVLGLLLAWGAAVLSRRRPTRTHTYGLRRTSIVAALANAVLLLVAVGGIAWEAIRRLGSPTAIEGWTVIVVAALGVVVNGASALLFLKGRHDDANVRGAFLHLVADAAVSLGVVVSGIVMLKTGWMLVDPLVSLLVALVVLVGTWGLLREAVSLTLDAVPQKVHLDELEAYLRGLEGVCEVHDLHVWSMSTTEVAMTAHLVVRWTEAPPPFLARLGATLKERFSIDHVTVQLEPGSLGACAHKATCAPDEP